MIPDFSMRVSDPARQPRRRSGFTFIELLTVITIIAAVTSLSVPALQSLRSSQTVNQAIGNVSDTVEFARKFAMANHTYVRVGFSEAAVYPGNPVESTIVITLYSVDGTLDAATGTDMADSSKWQILGKPMVLSSFKADDNLGSSGDDTPSSSNIAQLTRQVAALGGVSFKSFIQCNPNGETCVSTSGPSRYIKMGWVSSVAKNNLFVVRLSGINGSISILREEDL